MHSIRGSSGCPWPFLATCRIKWLRVFDGGNLFLFFIKITEEIQGWTYGLERCQLQHTDVAHDTCVYSVVTCQGCSQTCVL